MFSVVTSVTVCVCVCVSVCMSSSSSSSSSSSCGLSSELSCYHKCPTRRSILRSMMDSLQTNFEWSNIGFICPESNLTQSAWYVIPVPCLYVCPRSKRKMARAINIQHGRHTEHGSRSACVDPEVTRSKVKFVQLLMWVSMSVRLLRFSSYEHDDGTCKCCSALACFRRHQLQQHQHHGWPAAEPHPRDSSMPTCEVPSCPSYVRPPAHQQHTVYTHVHKGNSNGFIVGSYRVGLGDRHLKPFLVWDLGALP